MPIRRTLVTAAAAVLAAATVVLSPAQSAFAGEGPAPGPRPATPAAPTPPGSPTPGVPAEVHVEYRTADGVTHGAHYLAAPGVSADQLYKKLKATGVKGLIDPSTAAAAAASSSLVESGSCGYGTASNVAGTCPPLTWARNGYTNPQIYYNDRSGAGWPEGTVITEWNQSPNIHVARATGGCPGDSGTHCVDVSDGYYGATGWLAITYYNWDGNSHFLDGSVSIQYNDSYNSNHQAVACHETGHAFGMGHNDSTGSCLYWQDPQATWPNNDDYNEVLYQLYPR